MNMRLSTVPLVMCNIMLSSVANATLRFSASSEARVPPAVLIVGAFVLNTISFIFWYLILHSGEELSSTQVIVSSSMIVLGVSIGNLVFGEIITPLRCLGVATALLAIVVMFYAGRIPHGAVRVEEDTVNATGA